MLRGAMGFREPQVIPTTARSTVVEPRAVPAGSDGLAFTRSFRCVGRARSEGTELAIESRGTDDLVDRDGVGRSGG